MTSLQARKATRYVIGSDQKVEPDEWPIEALELGRGEVFELRDLKAVPELPGSAHLLGTDAATPLRDPHACIRRRDAIFQQSGCREHARRPFGPRSVCGLSFICARGQAADHVRRGDHLGGLIHEYAVAA
jgi:hypothetical protein